MFVTRLPNYMTLTFVAYTSTFVLIRMTRINLICFLHDDKSARHDKTRKLNFYRQPEFKATFFNDCIYI